MYACKMQTCFRWKSLEPTKVQVVKLLQNIRERHVQEVSACTLILVCMRITTTTVCYRQDMPVHMLA